MNRYEVIKDDVLNAHILDKSENYIREANKSEKTDIKLINELEVEIQNEDTYDDERFTTFMVFECMSCHWRFIGDVSRSGYGYTCEGQDTPDYCPMCGREIGELVSK